MVFINVFSISTKTLFVHCLWNVFLYVFNVFKNIKNYILNNIFIMGKLAKFVSWDTGCIQLNSLETQAYSIVICNDIEWSWLHNTVWFCFLVGKKVTAAHRVTLQLWWVSGWERERERQTEEEAVFRDSDYLYLLAVWAKRLLIEPNVSVHDSKQTLRGSVIVLLSWLN